MEPNRVFVRLLTQRSVSQFTFSSSDVWRDAGNYVAPFCFVRQQNLFYCCRCFRELFNSGSAEAALQAVLVPKELPKGELGYADTLARETWCVHREATRVRCLFEAVADRKQPGLAERRSKE